MNSRPPNHWFREEVLQMSPYIPGEQPQVGKFIKLNTNENPYPPSPKAIEAIVQAASSRLERYPDPLGTSFRIRAAEVLGVTPDHILCGNGSDDILTIVTRALVGKGDLLRLPYPSYILYRTLAQLQGASFEEVPFDADFGLSDPFYQPNPKLKLVFLPNPNSPSGTVIGPSEIEALASKLPCPILVDEAYADYSDVNCIELVKKNPQIMVSRTLSKSYALAGLRFGFLVAHPEMIAVMRKVKDSYNTDALSIAGATAAIDDQVWLRENRTKILKTRQRMIDQARAMGFHVVDSHANFIWCTHGNRPLQPLYESLKKQRVLVRYMNYQGWGEGLRISVGTDEQSDAAMSLMKGLL